MTDNERTWIASLMYGEDAGTLCPYEIEVLYAFLDGKPETPTLRAALDVLEKKYGAPQSEPAVKSGKSMTRPERDQLEKEQAEVLIGIECAYNTAAHPPYASAHEAWAVIREEYLESKQEITDIERYLEMMDYEVRMKHPTHEIVGFAQLIYKRALSGMIELAHVAAAAQKLLVGCANGTDFA